MSSIFDASFDKMSIEQVCFRLPGKLAVSALKRRILNLDTLVAFFDTCGTIKNGVDELKSYINELFNKYTTAEILDKFPADKHKILFVWLDEANKTRIKNDNRGTLSLKLLFNMTDAKDSAGLHEILDRILSDAELKQSQALAVLHKADVSVFAGLVNKVMRDKRDEIKSLVLNVGSIAKQ